MHEKQLWHKQANEGRGGAQDDSDCEGEGLVDSLKLGGDEVRWNKCQPYDAQGVQRDIDILGLVEIFRHFPGTKSKVGTQEQEEKVIAQSNR